MLAPKFIRENTLAVKEMLKNRCHNENLLEEWLEIDNKYREVLQKTEVLKAERNSFKPQGKPLPEDLEKMKRISEGIKTLDDNLRQLEESLNEKSLYLPNMLSADFLVGENETFNKEIKIWGKIPEFAFPAKAHEELGREVLDFARGAKLSGSRFTVYRGWATKLERALINFMLDIHGSRGWEEVQVPLLVNAQTMTGTGQLPKFAEDLYVCEKDGLYLIPTAEVPVTNIYRDEILEEDKLPLRFVAYTPCFRREAGSYGKDVSGLIRQHQFNKVELVMYCKPEDSQNRLEELTKEAELILELLELPYRRVQLCSGDTGFSSAKTYDLEVWFPSQNKYREISSCSSFSDFQARRAKIRYRNNESKPEFVHTLNGSGLAVGRTLAAIIENRQQENGSIIIPEVLKDYLKAGIINYVEDERRY